MQEKKLLEYADQQSDEYRSFRRFLKGIKSDATKRAYAYHLRNFARISKLGDEPDWDKLALAKKEEINIMVEDYLDHMEKRGAKGSSMQSAIAGIDLFFTMNDAVWSKKRICKMIKRDDGKPGGGVPITTSEIARMLENTKSLRTKALVHFFASTGCRPGALIDPVLRIKQLEMIENCYSVKIYDETKEEYYAFLTPEATASLDAYLEKRRQNGESITDESAVFASTPGSTAKEDHLQLKQVQKLMTNLNKMAGIKRTKVDAKRFDKAVIYQFRKRFNGILKLNNDVNSNIAEKLMAHKNGLDGVYLKPTREQCFTEFKKAILQLTIDPSERHAIERKQQQSELGAKSQELEELKARQAEMIKEAQEEAIKKVKDEFTEKLANISELKTLLEAELKKQRREREILEMGKDGSLAKIIAELEKRVDTIEGQ